ncbi:DUF1348 family protein [Kribbella sp. NPDC059898]|uniref:DUF1348 family protein n=1 Tax=Kribbella sp. NPDC059898 TaxID=3346995 RepID=UPI003660AE2F
MALPTRECSRATTRSGPLPRLDPDSAVIKVGKAEDAWNSRNPERVSLAYTPASRWRNRSTFLIGRPPGVGRTT